MPFIVTELPGVIVVEPTIHRDDRGFFLETYHAGRYAAAGIPTQFVQDNHSRSIRGALRGLHAQRRRPQAKVHDLQLGGVRTDVQDTQPGDTRLDRGRQRAGRDRLQRHWCALLRFR